MKSSADYNAAVNDDDAMNNDYSHSFGSETSGDKFDNVAESGEEKFLFCFSIKTGILIIGLLEVFAAIFQLMNMMIAQRLALFLFFFFNVPLLSTWLLS